MELYMTMKIKGNGRLIAIWFVVAVILAMAGGAITGALEPGVWPGRVVAGIATGCVVWLFNRLSATSGAE